MIRDEASGDLLARWRQGDQQAATELFRRYASRLVGLARSRLSAKYAHRVDPEELVQSVYRTFFAEAQDGRYELHRGGDLWRLLVVMTLHKLNDQVKYHNRRKRAVDRDLDIHHDKMGVEPDLLAREPSPLEALALADEVERLMRQLDASHRSMVELRLQGHTIEEIAAQTRYSERTVRYVLERVKQLLTDPGTDSRTSRTQSRPE
jgi:RNA polymerase sigma factor (sigma-70 family)